MTNVDGEGRGGGKSRTYFEIVHRREYEGQPFFFSRQNEVNVAGNMQLYEPSGRALYRQPAFHRATDIFLTAIGSLNCHRYWQHERQILGWLKDAAKENDDVFYKHACVRVGITLFASCVTPSAYARSFRVFPHASQR